MKTTMKCKDNLMSSRRVVEQAIDLTKSSKHLTWAELLAKSNDKDAKYPTKQPSDCETDGIEPSKSK